MANPFSGIITQNLINKYNYAIQEVIRANLTPARLIYPSTKWIECTNCSTDIFAGSPNPYLRGKNSTSCPVCGGVGKIQIETTEDMTIAVVFNYKKFNNIIPGMVVTPMGDAYTLSEIGTIKQIKTCKAIVFNTNLEAFNQHLYTRDGEPNPVGLSDPKFLITYWKVAG